MKVRESRWDDQAASMLREAQRAEIDERYGRPDSEPGPAPTADDISVFFVAYDDADRPVGCGGLRQLAPHEAEIKRMYVMPASRGSGASRAILERLEEYGRQHGWHRLVLETGFLLPEAIRFYEREGFTRIPNFGYYAGEEHSLCFAKLLISA